VHELEVKILDVQPELIVPVIESFGGVKEFEGDIVAEYFDYTSGSKNKKLKKQGRTLRLRQKGDSTELALKRTTRNGGVKRAVEHETNVDDFEDMKGILRELHLEVIRRITKHRLSYMLLDGEHDIHFEFDTLPNFPTYLEIESPVEDKLWKWVRNLGFEREQAKPWSTKDVIEWYEKQQKKRKK